MGFPGQHHGVQMGSMGRSSGAVVTGSGRGTLDHSASSLGLCKPDNVCTFIPSIQPQKRSRVG